MHARIFMYRCMYICQLTYMLYSFTYLSNNHLLIHEYLEKTGKDQGVDFFSRLQHNMNLADIDRSGDLDFFQFCYLSFLTCQDGSYSKLMTSTQVCVGGYICVCMFECVCVDVRVYTDGSWNKLVASTQICLCVCVYVCVCVIVCASVWIGRVESSWEFRRCVRVGVCVCARCVCVYVNVFVCVCLHVDVSGGVRADGSCSKRVTSQQVCQCVWVGRGVSVCVRRFVEICTCICINVYVHTFL